MYFEEHLRAAAYEEGPLVYKKNNWWIFVEIYQERISDTVKHL